MEDAWSAVTDNEEYIQYALMLISGAHGHMTALLENMQAVDFERTIFHPDQG